MWKSSQGPSIVELGFEPGSQRIEQPASRLLGFFRLGSPRRIRGAGIAEAPGILREPFYAGQMGAGVSGERQAHLF